MSRSKAKAQCNHVIEIHNDSGSNFCYLVHADNKDVGITTYICTYCPECGEQLREVTHDPE